MISRSLFCILMVNLITFGSAFKTISFSCQNRPPGYYADTSSGCEVYHMCDGLGRKFSYRCPNDTLFQQRMLICDHWYMVNCSRAEEDYSANLLIGQRDVPFVKEFQYERTPRPDLVDLSNPVSFQFYKEREKKRRTAINTIENIVGEDENTIQISSDERKYSPPGHWSTEYTVESATKPTRANENNNRRSLTGQTFFRTSYDTVNRFKTGNNNAEFKNNRNNQLNPGNPAQNLRGNQPESTFKVNFPSNFKATTPVYPREVLGVDLTKFYGFDQRLPPTSIVESAILKEDASFFNPTKPKNLDQSDSQNLAKINFKVNFPSGFKATTPVYPKEVVGVNLRKFYETGEDAFSQEQNNEDGNVVVNFQSSYKGTTPVYPKEVIGVDLNKFSGSEEEAPASSPGRHLVNFQSNYKGTTPVYPKEVIGVDLNKFSGLEEVPPAFGSVNNVNFQSNFRGTTPVYPKAIDPTSPQPDEAGLLPPDFKPSAPNNQQDFQYNHVNVNFESNFKGTSPVYPNFVEATSPNPNEFGLLPPKQDADQERAQQQNIDRKFVKDFEAPRSNFNKRNFRRPNKLDITLEGEDVEESVLKNTFNSKQLTEYMLSMNPEELKELRGQWHIPDYDFPLETVNRPSYETVFSSYKSDSNVKSER